MEEISLGVDTSEEDLENAAKIILKIMGDEGIAGQYSRIEKALEKINDIGLYSSALISTNGFVIASALNENLKADSLAAYSSVIFETIQNALEDSGFMKAQSVHLEGRTGRIKIFPGREVLLVAYEERKAGEIEDEGGMLPGETVLREAILKKVLENLDKIDGIEGNIIAGRDGLIIESNIRGHIDPNSLGYLTSLVVSENESYLELIQGGPIRQILLKTPDTYYNMIPIEFEAILTTCLDPFVPAEVWQSQLPQSALIIKSALS